MTLTEIREMCEKATNPQRFQDSVDFYDMAREELPRLVGVLEAVLERLHVACPFAMSDSDETCDEEAWCRICETPRACSHRKMGHILREAGLQP